MATRKNSRRQRARTAGAAPAALSKATQRDLVGQLQHMAAEVGQLQSELAAAEALVTAPLVTAPPADRSSATPSRPGAGWTPSPEPQPWLDARSA